MKRVVLCILFVFLPIIFSYPALDYVPSNLTELIVLTYLDPIQTVEDVEYVRNISYHYPDEAISNYISNAREKASIAYANSETCSLLSHAMMPGDYVHELVKQQVCGTFHSMGASRA